MTLRTKDQKLVRDLLVDETALGSLRATFRGDLIRPGDDAYEQARQVWNAMVDHHPVLIARCLGVADVASAIRFAREQDLELSVRGGGHSIVGHSVVDGGVVVDLSRMRGVEVDPGRRRATVQGGAWIADLDRETHYFGLATTGGLVADTGVAGLTLGGGYGWLARRFGLACDNLRAAQLVLADGSLVSMGADEHPDLFWAIRGGSGNFGVATSLGLELHPFRSHISTGDIIYRYRDGMSALGAFRDCLAAAPDELYLLAWTTVAVETTPVPEEFRGEQVVGLSWVWLGDDPGGGEQATRMLHRAGRPIADAVETMSYVTLQSGLGGLDRPRKRAYWKSSFLDHLGDQRLRTFLDAVEEANAGRQLVTGEVLSMGGAISRVGEDDTAYSHRNALVDFLAVSGWTDPGEDAERMAAARHVWQAVAGDGTGGVYINNLGNEGQARVREAFGQRSMTDWRRSNDATTPTTCSATPRTSCRPSPRASCLPCWWVRRVPGSRRRRQPSIFWSSSLRALSSRERPLTV